jgi:hypothetical protein
MSTSHQLASHWGGTHSYGYTGKIDIRREPLTADGYTKGKWGKYFGVGAPLWHVTDYETGGADVDFYVRASDKDAARAIVQDAYPGAKAKGRRRM